ncbi:hypothetical protein QCA50_004936 [Cerrena zonata]|uniref:Ricin B lectin domain-containing protein n=1 Tax=Cerrena zonata TaxID=2478898 RepID=A0AAW0GFZ5_9APHY
MFISSFTKLVALSAAFCAVVAKPALPVPPKGEYRIQNADTGLWLSEKGGKQTAGTPVTVELLEKPPVGGSLHWNFATLSSDTGTLQTTLGPSWMLINVDSADNFTPVVNPNTRSVLTIQPAPGGAFICGSPISIGCFTSPTNVSATVLIEPYTGNLNQIWEFNPIGNP